MAVIREHFASKGLGLHNDLQNEHSIVGNLPIVTMLDRYGTDEQKAMIDGSITGKYRITFGLTEPEHGSDATHMATRAAPAGCLGDSDPPGAGPGDRRRVGPLVGPRVVRPV